MKARGTCVLYNCEKRGMQRGLCTMHYERWRKSGSPYRPTVAERFWTQIERRPSGCWEWVGYTDRNRYGRFGQAWAHRFSYELLVGPIPEGLHIDHLCSNQPCVNPSHLEPVTHAENIRRAARRYRPSACPKGHPYDEVNLFISSRGTIRCRACQSAYGRDWYLRHRTLTGPLVGEKHPKAKLTEADVREILLLGSAGVPRMELAEKYGVSRSLVRNILVGKAWCHIERAEVSA